MAQKLELLDLMKRLNLKDGTTNVIVIRDINYVSLIIAGKLIKQETLHKVFEIEIQIVQCPLN